MNILVTGGAGFIGSALVRYLIESTSHRVLNLDKLTYAGHTESLESIASSDRYEFLHADICDRSALEASVERFQPDAIMHLAAESHVDRSISASGEFIQTNIVGTFTLLEVSRFYWQSLSDEKKEHFRFHHISTDEVYGELGEEGLFSETTRYAPNSPYSASKASSDHLVRAWHATYGLPILITNCSNNYGPYQFPEKLIPLMTLNALSGKPLPVYGSGKQVRDWLYVGDHVDALYKVLNDGRTGETYNIGGGCEMANLDVVRLICELLEELAPDKPGVVQNYRDLIEFVEDRPGHDFRYAIDASKIERELGWQAKEQFKTGLRKTIKWLIENEAWCDLVVNK